MTTVSKKAAVTIGAVAVAAAALGALSLSKSPVADKTVGALTLAAPAAAAPPPAFRPPATPLVTSDPFLSIWSKADRLTDKTTQHWTNREQPLVSLVRIDGKSYRIMGATPASLPALPQTSVQVLPTRTIYQFANESVHVTLTFTTAILPSDFDALSRPLTYLTWDVSSVDGKSHAVSIYDGVGGLISVNDQDEPVTWKRETFGPVTALSIGTQKQNYLSIAGDGVTLDWGYAYLSTPTKDAKAAIGAADTLTGAFIENGALPAKDETRMPRPANDAAPTLAVAFDLGNVGAAPVSRHTTIAYDEVYAINFFREKLRPYWRRNGGTPATLLPAAEKDYTRLTQACVAFDTDLMADMTKTGGAKYATMTALAYRQCFAATGLAADHNGQPLFLTKENNSNGDIGTVDIIFPLAPQWLLLSPTLMKCAMVPILNYGSSERWKFPNSPHDLGTYPIARGTDDGGEQMPVEESGNMILLCDAVAKADGNANFVTPWWPTISKWADYLVQYGLDPEEQLCTDDFMGHLAHNSNLSIKAILALAAYGDLCRMRGDTANADKYAKLAKDDAAHWMQVSDDGDHSRLAFDKPNTWSLKYNLVWDQILGLNVFPASVAKREIAQYKKVALKYGTPLDSRTTLTKVDWLFWSATLADNQADFEALINPTYNYLNTTTKDRMPFVDSYNVDEAEGIRFNARPVIGGVFIKMLNDKDVWKKWAARDTMKVGGWAPLPKAPKVTIVAPLQQTWRYTTDKPSDDWTKANFDDSGWKQGQGGFGNQGTNHTDWNTSDIWIRRTITVPQGDLKNLQFAVFHDEDIDIYINGVAAAQEAGYATTIVNLPITSEAKALMKPGATVTIAAHCHQTVGGQGIDVGLASVVEPTP
ncbi:hypothetical protein CCAX7_009060 [Capsulimonas corticalis]|uniref:Uncharacterized protein n=1 Tax=Capsulimonas corticalis TaxID=2219043 RepID=A0A402CU57_9BACT|nr:glutaminase family protein [Capsulimonas corticalis]BDI28855.1 hypothetical protein CCAX7_009060 [Capsulimonas corticalis]